MLSGAQGLQPGTMGSIGGPRWPLASRPPRPPRPRCRRSGLGPGCGSGAASSWRTPGLRPSHPRLARSRRRHCGAGFAQTSRQGYARGPPSSRSGNTGDLYRERKGTQEMLPGSEGGGGQCQAHMPLGHYKCLGGGRSRRSITSLLRKGSRAPTAVRAFPRSRSCEGDRKEE